ncbi:MAG TPA: hypothetical protein IAA23_04285 [Candidatus Helicobacter avistercoris]|nr:hypothetical protein [Candidatus Helicobacter avistercoris]
MKKLLLAFAVFCSTLGANESSNTTSQWQSYFGVEGGVGILDIAPFFLFGYNSGLFGNEYGLRGLSYGVGIFGGWQKYTSEKVGVRNTLGLRVFGTKDTKAGSIKKALFSDVEFVNETKSLIIDVVPYYALDGLFDFVRSGENRFGMNLGFAVDVLHLSFLKDLKGVGAVTLSARLGFYTQFNYNVIELIATSPLISVGGGKVFAYNSTLTLGYKYLF